MAGLWCSRFPVRPADQRKNANEDRICHESKVHIKLFFNFIFMSLDLF